MWFRKKKKESEQGVERRRQGPKFEQMRKDFEQKAVVTQTLKTAQAQTRETESRIEDLRRIARLGALKRR